MPLNLPGLSFEQVIQSSAEGFLALDGDFRVTFANRAALDLAGLAEHQVRGAQISTVLLEFDAHEARKAMLHVPELSAEFRLAGNAGFCVARVVVLGDRYGVWLRPSGSPRERDLQNQVLELTAQSSAVLDHLRHGVLVANGAGRIVSINPAARRLFRVPHGDSFENSSAEFELANRQGALLPREEWPLEQALRGNRLRDVELEVRFKDSEPWIASFNTDCVHDLFGRLRFAIVMVRDVSAVREAERALRENEDRHTAAMEAAHLGTWSWQIKSNRLYWSDRCRVLYGVRLDQPMTVESYRSRIHPEDRQKAQLSTEECLARPGELIEVEYRVKWDDGSVHWLQSWKQARIGADDQLSMVMGVVVNIDQRKAVEEELHRATAALRAIIDGSPMGIVAVDHAQTVTIWNAAAEGVLGFRAHDVVGQPSPVEMGIGSNSHDRELRVKRADGREIEILCSTSPIDQSDSTSGAVALFLDITERQRLRRRAQHLQHIESLGVLAGGIAHDFNNLLTGILGNASLCLYTIDEDHEAFPLLNEVIRSGERAATLTRQLLAYVGKGRLVTTQVNLSRLAGEAIALPGLPRQNRQIIATDLEPAGAVIEADAGQIQQVVVGLVTNAIEALESKKAGKVYLRTRWEMVSENAVPIGDSGEWLLAGRYAILEVEDTGSGMDSETMARIFEPFFSTKFTGRGLGLPAIVGIVRQHGGAVTVRSELARGSLFRVYLPALEPAPEKPPSEGASSHDCGRILVVDDEEPVRAAVRRTLENWGYEVVLAENGRAAMDVLPSVQEGLRAVFLDLKMPVMGGGEALELIRLTHPDLPIILISGTPFSETMGRLNVDGPHGFLRKPFTTEELAQTLCQVLDRGALDPCLQS